MEPWLYVAAGAMIAAAALYGLWYFRSERGRPYRHFRCPACRQKLRYWTRKAGQGGVCPRCLKRLNFPSTPTPTPAGGLLWSPGRVHRAPFRIDSPWEPGRRGQGE